MDDLRRRAERLEAIAELSASLAHEIRNPLASVRSAVEQLTADGVSREDKRVLEQLVVRESDRLGRLLTDFLDFARVQVTDPQVISLSEILKDVVQLARSHPQATGRRLEYQWDGAGIASP